MVRVCSAMSAFNYSMALVYSEITRSIALAWSVNNCPLKAYTSNPAISSDSESLTRRPMVDRAQTGAWCGSIFVISLWVRNMHDVYA